MNLFSDRCTRRNEPMRDDLQSIAAGTKNSLGRALGKWALAILVLLFCGFILQVLYRTLQATPYKGPSAHTFALSCAWILGLLILPWGWLTNARAGDAFGVRKDRDTMLLVVTFSANIFCCFLCGFILYFGFRLISFASVRGESAGGMATALSGAAVGASYAFIHILAWLPLIPRRRRMVALNVGIVGSALTTVVAVQAYLALAQVVPVIHRLYVTHLAFSVFTTYLYAPAVATTIALNHYLTQHKHVGSETL